MDWPTQQGTFDAGDLTLQSGAVLRGARLSWKAHGTLAPARDNVIVYPTSYGAQHPDLEWLIGRKARTLKEYATDYREAWQEA